MFLLISNLPWELSGQWNLEIWLRTPSREAGQTLEGPSVLARLMALLFKFPSEKDIPSSRIAIKECSKLSDTHSHQTDPFRECKRFPETFCIFPILNFRENRISSKNSSFGGGVCVLEGSLSVLYLSVILNNMKLRYKHMSYRKWLKMIHLKTKKSQPCYLPTLSFPRSSPYGSRIPVASRNAIYMDLIRECVTQHAHGH